MCKKYFFSSNLWSRVCWGGISVRQCSDATISQVWGWHCTIFGRVGNHDAWQLCFRADPSSLQAGSLNPVCLTVAPICLNTKNSKKEKAFCPCFAIPSSIISTVGGVPELRGPARLAGLEREHRVRQSHPQARSGRLQPREPRWQKRPFLWCRRLCSRCRCLSCCPHHLQHHKRHGGEAEHTWTEAAFLSVCPMLLHWNINYSHWKTK